MIPRQNQHDTETHIPDKTHITKRHYNEHMGKFTNIQTQNKMCIRDRYVRH